jgi:hypothetical protein
MQETPKKVIQKFCLASVVMITQVLIVALEKIVHQLLQRLQPPFGLILSTILMLWPE